MDGMSRKATMEDLERIWNQNIDDHPGDPRWVRWKEAFMDYNRTGAGATFVVICGGRPVGEGTLLFSPEVRAVRGRLTLADGKRTANINGLRIRKEYEGKGFISAMVREMERYAASCGYTALTIGVEAAETRNLGIYLHWGYDTLVEWEVEDGELVLYYRKELGGDASPAHSLERMGAD